MVVASGEQVTSGLTALALQELGVNARSWLGWQVPVADRRCPARRGSSISTPPRLNKRFGWRRGQVPVVAGSRASGRTTRVTTLGRGGSGHVGGRARRRRVEGRSLRHIFTDVDGVYDPQDRRQGASWTRSPTKEMLEMASLGAKVLQIRSVEMAMKHRVRLQVLSSFEDKPGTMVVDEGEIMEKGTGERHRL